MPLRGQAKARPAQVGRGSGMYARPPRILIVDDYVDARELYAEYLQALGYRCDVAADGADAVVRARAVRPAVVVMDLAMPVVDGWTAIRRLREDPTTAGAVIIVLTGHIAPNGDAARRAKDASVAAFLTKPCLPRELAETIATLLAGSRVAAS